MKPLYILKWGGAALKNKDMLQTLINEIAQLHKSGIQLVIVHGGGPEISRMCEHLKIESIFSNGQRITNDATLDIVKMVLGKINIELVNKLNHAGINAVGLTGADKQFILAKKLKNPHGLDLGWVGDIAALNTALIDILLEKKYCPVIAPLGVDSKGHIYNINADTVAGALAGQLKAKKLIMLSDVNGLYKTLSDPTTHIKTLKKEELSAWLKGKNISKGMIPKLQACLYALNQGVSCAHILDAHQATHLTSTILGNHAMGTMITC